MSNGFGFQPPPQANPQQVGQAMMRPQQMQGMQAPMMQGMEPPNPDDADRAMRLEGAKLMTTAQSTDGDAAVSAAVGEALTRRGGGASQSLNPFKDRARAMNDLQRLGLSQVEAELLSMTGGF